MYPQQWVPEHTVWVPVPHVQLKLLHATHYTYVPYVVRAHVVHTIHRTVHFGVKTLILTFGTEIQFRRGSTTLIPFLITTKPIMLADAIRNVLIKTTRTFVWSTARLVFSSFENIRGWFECI